MRIRGILNTILLIICIILFYRIFIYDTWVKNPLNIPSSNDVFSWVSFDTWIQENLVVSDMDKYTNIVQNTKNFKTVFFTLQPTQSAWNYEWNTNILRDYMLKNIKEISVPKNISGGYIYIKLRRTLPDNRSLALKTNVLVGNKFARWNIRTDNSLPVYNNNEYLFDLRNVSMIWMNNWDWLSHIKWKTITIWWYVWTFDWNWIEEITVARYY